LTGNSFDVFAERCSARKLACCQNANVSPFSRNGRVSLPPLSFILCFFSLGLILLRSLGGGSSEWMIAHTLALLALAALVSGQKKRQASRANNAALVVLFLSGVSVFPSAVAEPRSGDVDVHAPFLELLDQRARANHRRDASRSNNVWEVHVPATNSPDAARRQVVTGSINHPEFGSLSMTGSGVLRGTPRVLEDGHDDNEGLASRTSETRVHTADVVEAADGLYIRLSSPSKLATRRVAGALQQRWVAGDLLLASSTWQPEPIYRRATAAPVQLRSDVVHVPAEKLSMLDCFHEVDLELIVTPPSNHDSGLIGNMRRSKVTAEIARVWGFNYPNPVSISQGSI
jgi:hypothetical protein